MPGKYWVIQHTPTTHNSSVPSPAKWLLHHPPCVDYAIIEAAPVGRLTNLVSLDTCAVKRKGWISQNKWLHIHSFNSPGWMCKPLIASNYLTHHTMLIRAWAAKEPSLHALTYVKIPLASTHPSTMMATNRTDTCISTKGIERYHFISCTKWRCDWLSVVMFHTVNITVAIAVISAIVWLPP